MFGNIYNGILFFVLSAYTFVCFSVKTAAVFQQCGYRPREFFSSRRTERETLVAARFACVLTLSEITVSATLFGGKVAYFLVAAFGIAVPTGYALSVKVVKRARFTARFTRIYLLSGVLSVAAAFFTGYMLGCVAESSLGEYFGFAAIGISALLPPLLFPLSALVFSPYDKAVYKRSKKRCKDYLSSKRDLIKIGVTGSAGKTSVKNFLKEMLAAKYDVLATPKSYNTPLGICKTVLSASGEEDVFIAEMGARYKGDVAELCDMVRPDVGIITSVLAQHSETLGGIDGVKKTKAEILGNLGKFAVFSSDTEGSRALYEEYGKEKYSAGLTGVDVRVENVVMTAKKTTFDLILFGERHKAVCFLVGRHVLSDICLAACAAYKLGVTGEDIVCAVAELKPIEHRTRVFTAASGVTVIDDGYNANIDGARYAAEILSLCGGKKVVVTPGIVELGEESEKVNEELGSAFSGVADVMILVGANAAAIGRGYKGERYVCENSVQAKKMLSGKIKSGDTVLFLSDIPDRY